MEQEELDIRCLQLIRAALHNEERKLPEDWEEDPQEHRKYVTCSAGSNCGRCVVSSLLLDFADMLFV